MKLLRLFGAIFSLSLKRELTFRSEFIFQLLLTATAIIAGIATLGIVYSQTTMLGGWSLGEATALLGTFQVVSGMLSTFIEPNLAWFTGQVKNGKLDTILLQPVPSIFLASLGSCAPLGLAEVALGAILVLIGLYEAGKVPTAIGILGWLVMVTVGIAITWASRMLLASLAFWAPSVELDVLYQALWQCGRYPVSIYRQPIRFALTYMLPVAFISTIPAAMLIHGADLLQIVTGLIVGAGAIIVVQLVWNAGLRRYTSATS